MMRISILCAVTLLACISVNQAAPKSNWRNSQDDVAVRVVTWPPKSNERSRTSPKVLADPLRWVSVKDSQRYFENTDGLNWVEKQPGKEDNTFTEAWRKGSDESLVVVLKRSDKLYVKLSEGMALWSWNIGFSENNKIADGFWKKAGSTRNAVEVIGPYRIISRGEPLSIGEDCEEEQDVIGPYKIISRGKPLLSGDDCEDEQDQVGPYKIISRGEPLSIGEDCEDEQDQVGPYKIISRGEPIGEDCEEEQDVIGPYKIISRGDPVTVAEDCDDEANTRELVQPIKWQNANQEDHYFEKIDDFRWGEFANGEEVFHFVQVKVLAGSPDDPENFEVLLRKEDTSFVRLTNQKAWWGPNRNDITVNFANGFWLTTDSSRNSQQRNLLHESGSEEGECTSPSIDDNKKSMW